MDLAVGGRIKRTELHGLYGGTEQGGISPSRSAHIIMLFTDPKKGHPNGYFDGWGADGHFHYCGAGQEGDQKMPGFNNSVLRHADDGRPLHLFEVVAKGVVAYVGEFALAETDSWYTTDAPDRNGDIRSVIMFRLKPVAVTEGLGSKLPVATPHGTPRVQNVPLEQNNTEKTYINPSAEPRTAERREAALVKAYEAYLAGKGCSVVRKKILPPGELKPLFTDLFNVTDNVLVEAKGTVTREAIRMAIGQLLDYRRHLSPEPDLAILVPSCPRPDLLDLCAATQISVIWQKRKGFEQITAGVESASV
ncbi:restriction endonuclease [Streptomyces sp. URMC 123]|uniref:restriction endonuclease n=1 Tax=Streptomyces sp. URMC 123 TaxID=3423403 RepID=UPI003F19A8A9